MTTTKRRYENTATGTIFCIAERVDADTIAGKVAAGEWRPRPDLDKDAEAELAARGGF